MTLFIENLKKKKKLNNVYLLKIMLYVIIFQKKNRLGFIYKKPVAPVYIVNNYNEANELYENLLISEHFYKSTVTLFSLKLKR